MREHFLCTPPAPIKMTYADFKRKRNDIGIRKSSKEFLTGLQGTYEFEITDELKKTTSKLVSFKTYSFWKMKLQPILIILV